MYYDVQVLRVCGTGKVGEIDIVLGSLIDSLVWCFMFLIVFVIVIYLDLSLAGIGIEVSRV